MRDYSPLGPFEDNGRHSHSSMRLRQSISTTHRKILLRYAAHGSALAFVVFATIAFWIASFNRPILFSVEFGLIIRANTKYTTIACTVIGTLVSAFTIWLLNGILQLMSTQIITSRGATLSTIEVWSRMYNYDVIIDRQRIRISLFTIIFWIAALYLGTAYTALVTPAAILTYDTLSGTEIDFGSQDFWDWYDYTDADGKFNRTLMGCEWTKYQNMRGSVIYHTCAYDDSISFLTAGQSAAQYELGIALPVVSYLDKRYAGVTGGTLPQGPAGWSAFTDVKFDHWRQDTRFRNYNYTLRQQGLTADITCQIPEQGAIASKFIRFVNTSIPGEIDGSMYVMNFTWTCPDSEQSQTATVIGPKKVSANLQVCEHPKDSKEYIVYIGAFGDYANKSAPMHGVFFPNLTCTLKPLLTDAVVQYRTSDSLFRVQEAIQIPDSNHRVPNETYQAIDRAFSLAVNYANNMVIDSLHGVVATNESITYTDAMAKTLKGYIEFYSTNLRMYYSANEPPGRREVTGNYTVWRVGYRGQPVVLASLLLPLTFICTLAITYTILGLRAGGGGGGCLSNFNPIDGLPMLVASAAGGRAGHMPIQDFLDEKVRDARILETTVRYDVNAGHLVTTSHRSVRSDVQLVQVTPKQDELNREYADDSPLVPYSPESPRFDMNTPRTQAFTKEIS